MQTIKELTNIQASRLAIVGEPYAEVFFELFHIFDARENERWRWIVTIQNGIEVVEREWKTTRVQKHKEQRIWDEVSRILPPIADFTCVDDYNRYLLECNTSMDVNSCTDQL